jgi:hypothetical protein
LSRFGALPFCVFVARIGIDDANAPSGSDDGAASCSGHRVTDGSGSSF